MSDVALGAGDRGRTIVVQTGDRLVLRLPENPGTGYRWSGDVPEFLSLARDDNEPGDAPGGAGMRVMEFIAAGPGKAELRLGCTRSWEPGAAATDSFDLSVEVNG